MTDPGDQARLKRLQDVRITMELLHVEALAERDGRTFTTEETLALIPRRDLIVDTATRLAVDVLEPSPAVLEQVHDQVGGCVTVQETIEQANHEGVPGDA